MLIRKYEPSDCGELLQLFFDTVHTVNAKNYTEEQLSVWATGKENAEEWNQSFLEHCTFVAEEEGRIVGFGDIDETGYLDRLYVHKDYQRKGLASALCDELEEAVCSSKITTHASITARPFFEQRGYRSVKRQEVQRQKVGLINFVMEKEMNEYASGERL